MFASVLVLVLAGGSQSVDRLYHSDEYQFQLIDQWDFRSPLPFSQNEIDLMISRAIRQAFAPPAFADTFENWKLEKLFDAFGPSPIAQYLRDSKWTNRRRVYWKLRVAIETAANAGEVASILSSRDFASMRLEDKVALRMGVGRFSGDYIGACQDIERYVEVASPGEVDSIAVMCALMYLYSSQSDWKNAARCAKEVLSGVPRYPGTTGFPRLFADASTVLAHIAEIEGRANEAEARLLFAAQVYPSVSQTDRLATFLIRSRKTQLAKFVIEDSLRKHPLNRRLLLSRLRLLIEARELRQAKREASTILAPRLSDIRLGVGQAGQVVSYQQVNEVKEAYTLLAAVSVLEGDFSEARRCVKRSNDDSAEAEYLWILAHACDPEVRRQPDSLDINVFVLMKEFKKREDWAREVRNDKEIVAGYLVLSIYFARCGNVELRDGCISKARSFANGDLELDVRINSVRWLIDQSKWRDIGMEARTFSYGIGF